MAHSDFTVPAPPSTREARGLELYRRGGLERVARDLYVVPSRTRRRVEYLVDLGDPPSCECADHHRHGGPCRHAYAAMLYRAWLRRAARTIAPVLAAGDPITYVGRGCPACYEGFVYLGFETEEEGELVEILDRIPCRRCHDGGGAEIVGEVLWAPV